MHYVTLCGPHRNDHQTLFTVSSVTGDCLSQTFISAQTTVHCLWVGIFRIASELPSLIDFCEVMGHSILHFFTNFAPDVLSTPQLQVLNVILYVPKFALDLKVVPCVPGLQSGRLFCESVNMQFL